MDKFPEEVTKEHFDNLIEKHNAEEKKRLDRLSLFLRG